MPETRRPHDPAWYVPKGARKAHWFANSWYSACRYYADFERRRLAEPNERHCLGCEKARTP